MWLQVESALKPLLDAYFSPLSGVQVLAQPGNFYVASAFCLAVTIMAKKMVNHRWDNLAQGNLFNCSVMLLVTNVSPRDCLYFWHTDPMFFIQMRTMKVPNSCTTWMKAFMVHSAASCWEIPSRPHQCTRSVDNPDSTTFTRYGSVRQRFTLQ